MTIKLGVIMDPIQEISIKKDSTFAMLIEAQTRDWEIFYFEQKNLFLRDGLVYGESRLLNVFENEKKWFEFYKKEIMLLSDLDIILMRKDPPVDEEYIYTTHLLDHVEKCGTIIVNKPQALRDANEKLFASWFPQCCPPTLVTKQIELLREFLVEQQEIVCKPLNGMGGEGIFRLSYPDENASVVFEMLTSAGQKHMMAQRYIPEITEGDKRILMINGEPIPFSLARIPQKGELRGNLAAGGKGVAKELTESDKWICSQVGPTLREKGLYFVGLDVIGNFLTEINVTSPTCIKELNAQCNLNIAADFLDEMSLLILNKSTTSSP